MNTEPRCIASSEHSLCVVLGFLGVGKKSCGVVLFGNREGRDWGNPLRRNGYDTDAVNANNRL
jgi:hypothetical protein